jgi:hypothetical protein
MPFALPLKKMSQEEKLRAMEALWADLSKNEDEFESPAWHREILRETERLIAAGKAKFSDWETARRRIDRKTGRKS